MTVKASEWTPTIEATGLVRPNQGANVKRSKCRNGGSKVPRAKWTAEREKGFVS